MHKLSILAFLYLIKIIYCEQLVNKGDNLTLECPIDNKSSSTTNDILITWFKNNEKLTWLNRRIKIVDQKLKIRTAIESDSGVYMCQIISGTGLIKNFNITIKIIAKSGQSQSTTLATTSDKTNFDYDNEINSAEDYDYIKAEAPSFDDLDELVTKTFNQLEGSQIELNCNARGVPMPEIMWFKNGRIISEEEIGNIRSSMSLVIKDLRTRDSGNYTCIISNSIGRNNRTFQVNILETLKFIGQEPLNQTIELNKNVVFQCKVQSNAKITWFTNSKLHSNLVNKQRAFNLSVEIDGDIYYQLNEASLNTQLSLHNTIYPNDQFMSSIQIDSDGHLVLTNVQYNDIGYYLCIANNSKGYNYRKAYLNVVKPQLYLSFSQKTLNFLPNSALFTILLASVAFIFVLIVTLLCKNRFNNKRLEKELVKQPKKLLSTYQAPSITPQSTLITSSSLRKSTNSNSLNYTRSLPRHPQIPVNLHLQQPQMVSSPTPSNFKRTILTQSQIKSSYKYQPCACTDKPQYDNFYSIQMSNQPANFNNDMINWSDSSSNSRPYAKIQYQ